jgi:type I restriction enzyme S subunit
MSDAQSATLKFNDLIESGLLEIGDGYRAKNDELGGDGPLFLRAGLMTSSGFDWASADHFNRSAVSKVSTKLGRAYDTVITTKGNSIGRTAYVPTDAPEFVYSPHLSYWRSLDHDRISPGYLRYWAQSAAFLEQLRALAYGTDMAPYLSLADQKRLIIQLPSGARQSAIAEVLGALDDKIDANERIAATSMELARCEFTLACETEYTEKPLGDLVALTYGKALREVDRSPGNVPVYGCTGQIGWHDSPLTPGPAAVIGRKGANAGWISWSPVPCWVIDTAFFATILDTRLVPETAFLLLERANLPALLGDSAIPGLNRDAAAKNLVRVPFDRELRSLARVIPTLLKLVTRQKDEVRVLAQLRDTLLPKLMSGQTNIRQAEKAVEAAT